MLEDLGVAIVNLPVMALEALAEKTNTRSTHIRMPIMYSLVIYNNKPNASLCCHHVIVDRLVGTWRLMASPAKLRHHFNTILAAVLPQIEPEYLPWPLPYKCNKVAEGNAT